MKKSFYWTPIRVAFTVAILIITAWNIRNAAADSGDFVWGESRLLLQHINPYKTGQAWHKLETEWGGDGEHYYPPSALIFLWPWALLGWTAAKFIWLTFNLCMSATIFGLIRKIWLPKISINKFFLFVFLIYASEPWREVIGAGQQTIFVVGFFLMGYQQALAGHPIRAGFLLQLSLLKWTLTLPIFLWMAFSGFPLAVAIAFLTQSALFVFSSFWLAMTPKSLFREYVHYLKHASVLGDTDISAIIVQFKGLSHPHALIVLFWVITFSAIVWWQMKVNRDPLALMSLLLIWSIMSVYHGNYDMCAFIFPLALLFKDWTASLLQITLGVLLLGLRYSIVILIRLGLINSGPIVPDFHFWGLLLIFVCLIWLPKYQLKVKTQRQLALG